MKLLPIRRGEITRTQIGFSVVPVIRGIMNASSGPVVEPGPRRLPAEPQIVGSNPTRPAIFLRRVPFYWGADRGILAALGEVSKKRAIVTDTDDTRSYKDLTCET